MLTYDFTQGLLLLLLLSHFSHVQLWDPIDGSPPDSAVPGILQARTLEWVAISFSSAWKWKVKVKSLRRVWLFATPWTEPYQAPLSMGFSRPVYWSGLPLPSPTQGLCNLNSLQPRGLYISCQAPLTMGFSRQEYWNRLPLPTPGDLPDLGIESVCLASLPLTGDSLPLIPPGQPTWEL